MKKGITRSNSMKYRNSGVINILEDKLFSKLEKLQDTSACSKYDTLDTRLFNTTDALSQLIYKAKGIAFENQDKIKKAKRELRTSKKQNGTFLTGTGIYAAQVQEEQTTPVRQQENEYDPQQMLKNLTKKGEYDDLAQLRRMIKVTDQNLGGYTKQVHQIKKEVLNAANQFKSQMDFDLTYKLNRLQAPPKKSSSVAKLKNLNF